MNVTDVLSSPELQTALVNVVLATVTAVAGLASRFVLGWLKAKLNANQLQTLERVVTTSVEMAEQLGATGVIADKKAKALEIASNLLKQAGVKVSPQALDASIEAAVLREFNAFREYKPVEPSIEGAA